MQTLENATMEQERHRPLTEAEERKLETDTHSLRVSWCKLALNLLKQRRHYFGLVSLTIQTPVVLRLHFPVLLML